MAGDPLAHEWCMGRLRKLAEASSIVGSTRSPDTLPTVIAEQARIIIGAHVCVVKLNTDQMPERMAITSSRERVTWQAYADRLNTVGAALSERSARLSQAELAAQPAWRDFVDLIEQNGEWSSVCGWLAAAIPGPDSRSLGLIQLLDGYNGEFTEADEMILTQFGWVASLAIQSLRSHDEAQHAVRSRDELLSLAAHELKNPITSVRGFAQTLLRQLDKGNTPDAERLRHTLQSIEQQSDRMTRIINDVREVARLDAGRIRLDLKPADITALAESVVMQATGIRRPVTVQDAGRVVALVDPLRWQQALTYLIEYVNAYSAADGPIEISATNVDAGSAQLSIADRESTTPAGEWQQVIDGLQQARTPGSLGGSGLGLYIACQLIGLHGGALAAESLPERGTRLVVSLPTR